MSKKREGLYWRKVEKPEFDEFIATYPNPLEVNVTAICEPPLMSYNDFTNGKIWPDSMVAKVVLYTLMDGHPAYRGESNVYYVLTL